MMRYDEFCMLKKRVVPRLDGRYIYLRFTQRVIPHRLIPCHAYILVFYLESGPYHNYDCMCFCQDDDSSPCTNMCSWIFYMKPWILHLHVHCLSLAVLSSLFNLPMVLFVETINFDVDITLGEDLEEEGPNRPSNSNRGLSLLIVVWTFERCTVWSDDKSWLVYRT